MLGSLAGLIYPLCPRACAGPICLGPISVAVWFMLVSLAGPISVAGWFMLVSLAGPISVSLD